MKTIADGGGEIITVTNYLGDEGNSAQEQAEQLIRQQPNDVNVIQKAHALCSVSNIFDEI